MLLIMAALFFVGCDKKSPPIIKKDTNLSTPVQCLALNDITLDKAFKSTLNSLYTFDQKCDLQLFVSYKRDIVCNSPYNPNRKNIGPFPKSFLNMEVRRGFKVEYSYYVDLYHNVNESDIKEAFARVKKDIINPGVVQ